jgi:16S rRNA (cytidine1402-2'-O)-methyltransferase
VSIEPGVLYVVATPIGNLADFSERAREVLAGVDVIACEDTRHTGRLLSHFRIRVRTLSLHEHNERQRIDEIIALLREGRSVALVSDAGTPLISDPGFPLLRAVAEAGLRASPVPGPSALVAALSVSGLPTDRFAFEGFLPAREAGRAKRLRAVAGEPRTLVFYESTHRLGASLRAMADALGATRAACVCRELTKVHEQIRNGSLERLAKWAENDPDATRGEAVIVVAGAPELDADAAEAERILRLLLAEVGVRQAASLAAAITGRPRNALYRQALDLKTS